MAEYGADILLANEAEMYVERLRVFEMREIGNPAWLKQHDFLEKLNVQAHLNVTADSEEFVMEYLISYDKIKVLVHELILLEAWRQHVYPELQKLDFCHSSTMVPYIVFYHEATIVNLLEAILYHKEACEATQDCAIDLVDYCHRALVYLGTRTEEDHDREREMEKKSLEMAVTGEKQLEQQMC
eukprot:UC1_evm1s731